MGHPARRLPHPLPRPGDPGARCRVDRQRGQQQRRDHPLCLRGSASLFLLSKITMTKLDSTIQPADAKQSEVRPASMMGNRWIWVGAALLLVALLVLAGWWYRVPELHGVLLQS